MRKQLEGTLALLLGTFIWGMAFIAQSVGGELIGPFTFQAIRRSRCTWRSTVRVSPMKSESQTRS